jgi:hypothetical protein
VKGISSKKKGTLEGSSTRTHKSFGGATTGPSMIGDIILPTQSFNFGGHARGCPRGWEHFLAALTLDSDSEAKDWAVEFLAFTTQTSGDDAADVEGAGGNSAKGSGLTRSNSSGRSSFIKVAAVFCLEYNPFHVFWIENNWSLSPPSVVGIA